MELWKAGTHTWLWGGMTICPRARSPPGVFGLLSGGPIQFYVKLNEALGTPIP